MRRPPTPLSLAACLALAACGGSGGGGGFTLTGSVTKAPVASAAVVVYGLSTDGATTGVLGQGTTGSDGHFAIALSKAPSGPIDVEATGGSYVSESDGTTVSMTTPCDAVVVAPSAGTAVTIDPISDLVTVRAAALLQGGAVKTVADAVTHARSDLNLAFGITADPGTLAPSFDFAQAAGSDPVKLGLLLVALDSFAHTAFPSDPDSAYAALDTDFVDGKLDDDASVSTYGALPLGTSGAVPDAQQFQDALLRSMHYAVAGVANGIWPMEVRRFASASANLAKPELQPDLSAHYTCDASTQLVSVSGDAVCWDGTTDGGGTPYFGTYYTCGTTFYSTDPGSCPDSSIPVQRSSTSLAAYQASPVQAYVAQQVQPFSDADLAAMDAELAGAPLPAWATGPLTQEQLNGINDLYGGLQGFYDHP